MATVSFVFLRTLLWYFRIQSVFNLIITGCACYVYNMYIIIASLIVQGCKMYLVNFFVDRLYNLSRQNELMV